MILLLKKEETCDNFRLSRLARQQKFPVGLSVLKKCKPIQIDIVGGAIYLGQWNDKRVERANCQIKL